VYVEFSIDFWGKVWYNKGQLGKRDSQVLPETLVLGGASSAPPLEVQPRLRRTDLRRVCDASVLARARGPTVATGRSNGSFPPTEASEERCKTKEDTEVPLK